MALETFSTGFHIPAAPEEPKERKDELKDELAKRMEWYRQSVERRTRVIAAIPPCEMADCGAPAIQTTYLRDTDTRETLGEMDLCRKCALMIGSRIKGVLMGRKKTTAHAPEMSCARAG